MVIVTSAVIDVYNMTCVQCDLMEKYCSLPFSKVYQPNRIP